MVRNEAKSEPEKNLWDYITDHPKVALALALIALGATFSPQISSVGSWSCLAVGWVLIIASLAGYPALQDLPHHRKILVGSALVIALIITRFGLFLNQERLDGDPRESQFRLGTITFLPPVVGQPQIVNFAYTNVGPSEISLHIVQSVSIIDQDKNMHFGLDKGEDYKVSVNSVQELEELVWTAFLEKFDSDPTNMGDAADLPPFRPGWSSAIGPPISEEEISALTNKTGKAIIFLTLRFTWKVKGTDRLYAYDACEFITESNAVQFNCDKHNGPVVIQ